MQVLYKWSRYTHDPSFCHFYVCTCTYVRIHVHTCVYIHKCTYKQVRIYVYALQVIEWASHHKDDPPPPEDDENKEKRTDDIEPWDQDFLKVDQGTLFELILVSGVVYIT